MVSKAMAGAMTRYIFFDDLQDRRFNV